MLTLTDKQISLLSWLAFGLALIALTLVVSNAFLETQTEFSVTQQQLSEPILRLTAPLTGTATWKTYRNEQYGFEFRYPPDWENPVERNGAISFGVATPDDYEGMKLLINIVSNGNKTLDQVISEYDSGYGVSVNDIEMATLGGIEGKKFVEYRQGGFTAFGLFAIHDNYIYKIWYGNRPGGVPIPPTVPQVQRILSTFKFIEPAVDTSTWRAYRNTKYSFEFRYPPDHTAWVDVDQKNQTLVPALPTSDSVAVTETESQLFCCEPNNLFISVVPGTESPRVWLDQHVGEFTTPAELKSVTDTAFAGENAVEMRGAGSIGSAYRVLLISRDDHLVVISQGAPSVLFDTVLATFKFTK